MRDQDRFREFDAQLVDEDTVAELISRGELATPSRLFAEHWRAFE
jgi:hypothetical protein